MTPTLSYFRNGRPSIITNLYKILWLNTNIIQINSHLGKGTHGDIYNALYNGLPIVIKISKETNKTLCIENQIQTELYKYHNVPNPIFMSKYRVSSKNNNYRYIMGMERMTNTAYYFIRVELLKYNKDEQRSLFIEMIKSVVILIQESQNNFNFHHRDLHCNNIMYTKISEGKYKWYMIDFDMSVIILNGRVINGEKTKLYPKFPSKEFTNYGHDLRTFLSSMDNIPSDLLQIKNKLFPINTNKKYGLSIFIPSPHTEPHILLKKIRNI